MPTVLIVSSFVAASRVGGGAQALTLARLGLEPVLAPTVLFGRHPGWGPPGGAAVAPETLEAMLAGIEAQGVFERLDAVITGHFSLPEQVALTARALDRLRAVNPVARIVVDPIMGDEGKGLYVKPAVAEAIAAELVGRADLVAPNAWELSHLTGRSIGDAAEAAAAARTLGKPVLASSIVVEGRIGVVYVDEHQAWLASHDRLAAAPNGAGDLLTVLFVAALASGLAAKQALHAATAAVARAATTAAGAGELPITAFPLQLDGTEGVELRAV